LKRGRRKSVTIAYLPYIDEAVLKGEGSLKIDPERVVYRLRIYFPLEPSPLDFLYHDMEIQNGIVLLETYTEPGSKQGIYTQAIRDWVRYDSMGQIEWEDIPSNKTPAKRDTS